MGNNSGKESRSSTSSSIRPDAARQGSSHSAITRSPTSTSATASDGLPNLYTYRRVSSHRSDLPFIRIGDGHERDGAAEPRKETRQEREARRAERDRVARLKERERSVREESVDGGYLVTLGTYTGPEDFSKPVVRQLMIERRLAPFWKGLNDHSDSWTEYQLVAAARGLPIPAADEVPPDDLQQLISPTLVLAEVQAEGGISSSPISMTDPQLSPSSLPSNVTAQPSTSAPANLHSQANPLLRGRSKTIASMSSGNPAQPIESTLPEVKIPPAHYNGQPVEAYLYKDATECPICFLYYPPYLNKTRCCDQPICSECFVQIKRPDPHPPEHAEPGANPTPEALRIEPDGLLVSEPAGCPFCVQPEFGVTYEPPPFRRGVVYQVSNPGGTLDKNLPAMSSTSSLSSSNTGANVPGRRRTHSISADAPTVITTDRVRPDWAKKLSDARAHAARRSAAATALHTAAFMMGDGDGRETWLARRRRTLTSGEGPSRAGDGINTVGALLAALDGQTSSRSGLQDMLPGRQSSRRTRVDDLEDMMMMEAIRQSLAAEEERKKKEEKENAKQAKKEEKNLAKEQKKARKNSLQRTESNDSTPSILGTSPQPSSSLDEFRAENSKGKGKAGSAPPTALLGFNPLSEPTSTLNTEAAASKNESPRPTIPYPISASSSLSATPDAMPSGSYGSYGASPTQGSHLRHMSNASSLESLIPESESPAAPSQAQSHLQTQTQTETQEEGSTSMSLDPVAFGSLAAIIDTGDGNAATAKPVPVQGDTPERGEGSEIEKSNVALVRGNSHVS